MYKILFLAFFFNLSNSEWTEGCPSDYFDSKDGFCYHIGRKVMTKPEAIRYCDSKNEGVLAIMPLSGYLENELVKIARSNGDMKWWVYDGELELEHVDVLSFKVNDLHHLQKRKPICQIIGDYSEY